MDSREAASTSSTDRSTFEQITQQEPSVESAETPKDRFMFVGDRIASINEALDRVAGAEAESRPRISAREFYLPDLDKTAVLVGAYATSASNGDEGKLSTASVIWFEGRNVSFPDQAFFTNEYLENPNFIGEETIRFDQFESEYGEPKATVKERELRHLELIESSLDQIESLPDVAKALSQLEPVDAAI